MHVWLWMVSGLVVGWLARVAIGVPRFSLLADLSLGLLGAVVGGSVFRLLGITAPANGLTHVVVGMTGAMLLVLGVRLIARMADRGRGPGGPERSSGLDLEARVRRLGEAERRVLAKLLGRERISRDTVSVFEQRLTFGERVADRVATFGGSWIFIGLFVAAMIAWIAYNLETAGPFDPYPFILLNLVLSCLAALQAPIIMMSQNRQAAKDRLEAQNDYQVNVKAEMEVAALHLKLDELRDARWAELVALQERQLAVLARVDEALAGLRASTER